MDLKQAYEILGLPEGADLDEVERKYDMLLRRADSRIRREPGPESQAYLDQINQAYRLIRDTHRQREIEEYEQARYGNRKWIQKLEHFWEYYRFHLIGAVVGIIIIAMITQSIIENRREANQPPPDLEIMLFGDYRIADAEALEEALAEALPELERIRVIHVAVSFDMNLGYDPAMQQKAIVMLATERPHIYLVDESTFHWLGTQGPFQDLEPLVQRFGVSETLWVKGTTEEDPTERIYGIDTTDHEIWSSIRAPQAKKIVTVSVNHELSPEIELFIRYLLESLQEQAA